MNTLLRTATVRFSPSPLHIYVPLDDGHKLTKNRTGRRFSSSRRPSTRRIKRSPEQPTNLSCSISYRQRRARQRQIFLRTYRLASIKSLAKSRPRKLVEKAFLRLRRVAVRIISLVRIRSARSCSCISGAVSGSPGRGSCI
ncbi:hypothetical protein SAY87_027239 [Trapa incisa]|uniref:Uncharacterized protein n=1 Tax=Trapa incisa TaxID=236973 RepID=A0AAN7H0L5_9MYRT|nr:hypothetical protein SAY87_027239 [Trapa incisa]